jgi:hypothetical protein
MTYDPVKAHFMKQHRLSYVRVVMEDIGSHIALVCVTRRGCRGDAKQLVTCFACNGDFQIPFFLFPFSVFSFGP